jgi:hypothetical protein
MRRSSSSAAARIIWICSSVVRSGASITGSDAADSSSMADSEAGAETGKRSSSDRYALAVDSSQAAFNKEGRLGHDGNAQEELMPMAVEKDDLRGVISRSVSLGVGGGGGGGGSEDGEGDEEVLALKLKLNRMVGTVVS